VVRLVEGEAWKPTGLLEKKGASLEHGGLERKGFLMFEGKRRMFGLEIKGREGLMDFWEQKGVLVFSLGRGRGEGGMLHIARGRGKGRQLFPGGEGEEEGNPAFSEKKKQL